MPWESFRQLNLYSTNKEGLSDELFTDPIVNWHSQQFGKQGLVASAGLCIPDNSRAFVTLMQSDLCQQISRHSDLRRKFKTRVDHRFKRWHRILFNAILDYCLDRELSYVFSPTSHTILRDIARPVIPTLFQKIYDDIPHRYRCSLIRIGNAEYWCVPVIQNRDRVARLRTVASPPQGPLLGFCLFHDIEENIDTAIDPQLCRENLQNILALEVSKGVATTESILGRSLLDKRVLLSRYGRRSFAFHSFNHDINDLTQLMSCRRLDWQIRGYRPPRSRITKELTDYNLSYYNFEWLLSSALSLGHVTPYLQHGIVKIPVHLDDHDLYTGSTLYPEWWELIQRLIDRHSMVVLGLHDCYAGKWLPHYEHMLEAIGKLRRFWTCDDIADWVYMNSSALL